MSPLWFACAYIFLMLMSPVLQLILELPRSIVRSLLLIGLLTISVYCSIHRMQDGMTVAYLWFVYVFLFIGYYKRYLSKNSISKWWFLLAGVGIYLALVSINIISNTTDSTIFGLLETAAAQYRSDYKSLPNAVCSICLFLFFTKLELPANKTVNTIASSAFAVYIIHQVPVFYDHLWYDIMRIESWYDSQLLFPYIFLCVIVLYAVCMVIDTARKRWIEPLWVRSRIFKFVEQKIDGLYRDLSHVRILFDTDKKIQE